MFLIVCFVSYSLGSHTRPIWHITRCDNVVVVILIACTDLAIVELGYSLAIDFIAYRDNACHEGS